MCGIGGILFSKKRSEELKSSLEQINRLQKHRGPDGQGIWLANGTGLCHQRLSLLDAAAGSQPFIDASGRYVIVFNGEIYNFRDLRKQLDYPFSTDCDTEVLLAAYIAYGAECLAHFSGMYALLIWDTQTQTAFAARDPAGVKPFVYSHQNGTFYFASEQKAILACIDKKPEIDLQSLAEYIVAPYLSGNGTDSIFSGIHYLEPGCYLLIYPNTGLSHHKHFNFCWQASAASTDALQTELTTALERSVQESLVADVPVGLFLSGGLDSSLIAAIAKKHAQKSLESYVVTFSEHHQIHFDSKTIVNSDDLPFAKQLATELKIPLHHVPIYHDDLADSMSTLARINDRIPAWEQEWSQYFLAQEAAKKYKAILVGDAADETHYGYFFLLNETVNRSPLALMNHFGAEKRIDILAPWIRQEIDPLNTLDRYYRRLVAGIGLDFDRGGDETILAMSHLIYQRWLGRLLHNGDCHTMHFGLEARLPFASKRMLEAASTILPHQGFFSQIEKHFLRQVAEKWLPTSFAWRKKSALPRDPRLGSAYQQILRTLLQQPDPFIDHYLNREALNTLSAKPSISEQERMLLFNAISLIYWSRHYV